MSYAYDRQTEKDAQDVIDYEAPYGHGDDADSNNSSFGKWVTQLHMPREERLKQDLIRKYRLNASLINTTDPK